MLRTDDDSSLALLFHLNSEPWRNDRIPLEALYEVRYRQVGEIEAAVPLPAATDSPVLRSIQRRRSCRAYRPDPIDLAQLATLLEGAYGITGVVRPPRLLSYFTRAVPSGGGLYPLELYVVARRVTGLPPGLFHFNVREHMLEPMSSADPAADIDALLPEPVCPANASAVILFTAVFRRSLRKYGPRGYRFILMEAGHAAQNVCLLATEQGLGSLCIGGFRDRELNCGLGLDGWTEAALYAVAVGHAAESESAPGPSDDLGGSDADRMADQSPRSYLNDSSMRTR